MDVSSPKQLYFHEPFDKDDVPSPPVKRHKNPKPYPIKYKGHLPVIGPLEQEEKDRLSKFYNQSDLNTYILKKNE